MPQGDHFWTTNPDGEAIPKDTWGLEGEACRVLSRQVEGTQPFYRWIDNTDSIHFWTTDPNGELLPKPKYRLEGIACYLFSSQVPGTVPLLRFFSAHAGLHFWTAFPQTEQLAPHFAQEGPVGYVFTRATVPGEFAHKDAIVPLFRWHKGGGAELDWCAILLAPDGTTVRRQIAFKARTRAAAWLKGYQALDEYNKISVPMYQAASVQVVQGPC